MSRESRASRSVAESGDVEAKPEDPVSVVTKNKDGEPRGVLEKWSEDAWIYARRDSLHETR